jgi:ketosteroid isomerase-like protein
MLKTCAVILVAIPLTIPNLACAADAPAGNEIESVTKEFVQAFVEGDAEKMQPHFAPDVIVERDPERGVRKKEQLRDDYAKMISAIGRDRWSELFKKVKPTVVKAAADGEVFEFVKAGDYICDLHWRESREGQRNGLDEAVIFVFRLVDGKYKVIGHFADY